MGKLKSQKGEQEPEDKVTSSAQRTKGQKVLEAELKDISNRS